VLLLLLLQLLLVVHLDKLCSVLFFIGGLPGAPEELSAGISECQITQILQFCGTFL